MSVPITPGSGATSVAAEAVGGLNYQQIEVYGKGGASVLGINPDGSINASIIGLQGASVSGTVNVGNLPTTQNVSGSVVGFQGTSPWIITGSVQASVSPAANQSVSGTVQTDVRGSVATVIIGGSIAASFTPPANQSVSGTVTANQGTNPWIITGSVQGSFSPSGNQSVSGTVGASIIGTVPATQSGTWSTSVMTNVITSIATAGQVMGSVAALQATNPWNVAGSVAAFIVGNSSVIVVPQASSILAVPVGSVQTIWLSPSVVGTYAEDAAHTSGDKGIFVMQVRNDTMSSITSADGDYSPIAGGPVGETITANAPITKWVQGTADLRGSSGGSVTVIAAQGASIFTYITGLQVANMGSASVLVTLSGATSSIVGYTIAPAGGGSNILYPNALKTNANGAFSASISGVASVLVSAQGFISKT